jgi:hypothetical protein
MWTGATLHYVDDIYVGCIQHCSIGEADAHSCVMQFRHVYRHWLYVFWCLGPAEGWLRLFVLPLEVPHVTRAVDHKIIAVAQSVGHMSALAFAVYHIHNNFRLSGFEVVHLVS